MELVVTPENPAPPGAVPATIRSIDGLSLRVVRWHPPSSRGTVVVAQGRAEFVEKYFETVDELLERGFAVVCFDWRGQGLSTRELKNPHKGHVDDFTLYERDLDAVREQVLEPFCPKPWFGLGHSMGASILLAQAHAKKSPFERLILCSPLIELAGRGGLPLAKMFCETADILGFGASFIPGGRRRPYLMKKFDGNFLTSDRARFERCASVIAAAPAIALADPTIGWVNAAFRQMRQFANPEYPRSVHTPILIVASSADRVVSARAIERFAVRLKAGDVILLPRCRHEILLERDVVRRQFWAAFDAFAPGLVKEAETSAAQSRLERPRRSWWRRRARVVAEAGSPAPQEDSSRTTIS